MRLLALIPCLAAAFTNTALTGISRGLIRSAKHSLASLAGIARVDVDLPDRSYPIYIGTDLLQAGPDNLILKHVTSKKALIVTNTKIGTGSSRFILPPRQG
jgi:hypothetical protein